MKAKKSELKQTQGWWAYPLNGHKIREIVLRKKKV